MYTIRVVNYLGDWDTLNETLIIGPYDTPTARFKDIRRLERT